MVTSLKIHVTFSSSVLISSVKETIFSRKIANIDSDILNEADATVTKTLYSAFEELQLSQISNFECKY